MRAHRLALWSLLTALLLPVAAWPADRLAQLSEEDADDAAPASPASLAHLPAQELTAKVLNQMLLAEVAIQRDRLNLAVTTYLDLARCSRAIPRRRSRPPACGQRRILTPTVPARP